MTGMTHGHSGTGGWRREARRIAYENPWIVVHHDDVTRPDGAPGIYGVVHFVNVAVGVVAIDVDDRIVLVEQDRYTLGRRSPVARDPRRRSAAR